jgi:hypothetical protein
VINKLMQQLFKKLKRCLQKPCRIIWCRNYNWFLKNCFIQHSLKVPKLAKAQFRLKFEELFLSNYN